MGTKPDNSLHWFVLLRLGDLALNSFFAQTAHIYLCSSKQASSLILLKLYMNGLRLFRLVAIYNHSFIPFQYENRLHHFLNRDQQERPSVSMPSNTKDPLAMGYQHPHTSLSGYRHPGSHSQSRNNSAETVQYNQHEASYFYQHPRNHHPHSETHLHPETFYHSDQQEITSFSNTQDGHQDYHRRQMYTMDNEAHPFYQNPTQFHPGQGVQYGHYRTNPGHSDSAKV